MPPHPPPPLVLPDGAPRPVGPSAVGRHLPEVRRGRHRVEAIMGRLLALLLGALAVLVLAVAICGIWGIR